MIDMRHKPLSNVCQLIHVTEIETDIRRRILTCRSVATAGPTVWNSLPDNLRNPAVGPDQFRRNLKTHLFQAVCLLLAFR